MSCSKHLQRLARLSLKSSFGIFVGTAQLLPGFDVDVRAPVLPALDSKELLQVQEGTEGCVIASIASLAQVQGLQQTW